MDKVYHALVQGHLDPPAAPSTPHRPSPQPGVEDGIIEGGRESITHYDVIEAMPGACLAEIHRDRAYPLNPRPYGRRRPPLHRRRHYGADQP